MLPDVAYRAACYLLRDNGGLNGLTKNTLHKQLDSLGLLANKGAGGAMITKRCNSQVQRVLHIAPSVIRVTEQNEEEDDNL